MYSLCSEFITIFIFCTVIPVQEALRVLAATIPQISPFAPPPAAIISPPPRPPAPVSRLPGTPDNIAVVKDFPQRYRRRTLALEEMDYIQVKTSGCIY